MKIKAYSYNHRDVNAYLNENGGFNADAVTLTPMRVTADGANGYDGYWGMHEVLDNITLAAEAGLIDTETFVSQLFADIDSFKVFIASLAGYDSEFRITDRWWQSLASLAEHAEEEAEFISTEDIAQQLLNYAVETNQIEL